MVFDPGTCLLPADSCPIFIIDNSRRTKPWGPHRESESALTYMPGRNHETIRSSRHLPHPSTAADESPWIRSSPCVRVSPHEDGHGGQRSRPARRVCPRNYTVHAGGCGRRSTAIDWCTSVGVNTWILVA